MKTFPVIALCLLVALGRPITLFAADGDLNKKLKEYITGVSAELDQIPEGRKRNLESIGGYLVKKLRESQKAQLLILSRHNSKRSQMAQLWFMALAHHFGVKNVETFTGGIEPTAFDERAVKAMKNAGFSINEVGGKSAYVAGFAKDIARIIMYSKKYNDRQNPDANFMAVVLSKVVDERLPTIEGADLKVAVTYEPLEQYDNVSKTEQEEKYTQVCREIARDMFYLLRYVKDQAGMSN